MTITTVKRVQQDRKVGDGRKSRTYDAPASDTIRQATTPHDIAGIPIEDDDWRLRVHNEVKGNEWCVWPDTGSWCKRKPDATDIERRWIKFITVWKDMKNKGRWPSNIQMLALGKCFLRHEGMKDEQVDEFLGSLITGEHD